MSLVIRGCLLCSGLENDETRGHSDFCVHISKYETDAIKNLVSLMIEDFRAGFVDKNNPTLAQIHQVARNHIKDTYGIDTPDIVEEWGKKVAIDCGLKLVE